MSLPAQTPPVGLTVSLQALWYAAKGDWTQAHELVQSAKGAEAAWVHAYLHRQEGDTANANYWYRRAGQVMPQLSLDQEWQHLVQQFLADAKP